jgi:hypothetical protein
MSGRCDMCRAGPDCSAICEDCSDKDDPACSCIDPGNRCPMDCGRASEPKQVDDRGDDE